ncbi:MAG: hypothetical protein IJ860_02385 [Eubacterium sp.]|nr:hypothetical protein [Eubacterium sp.]
MIEELIRIEYGVFQWDGHEYQIDLSVSRGECIGLFADDHVTSGSACHGIFDGTSLLKQGKAFVCGTRVRAQRFHEWIGRNCMLIDRNQFLSKELTVWDFIFALGKTHTSEELKEASRRDSAEEARTLRKRMGIGVQPQDKLSSLSMLEYYRLAVYKAWVVEAEIVILDRVTEILRQKDLHVFMECVQILLEQGTAVILLDLDEKFMFRYASRIDIIRDRALCFRLHPEEYGRKLYEILGWESAGGTELKGDVHREESGKRVLSVSNLVFEGLQPMSFELCSGEIGFTKDENYRTGSRIRSCFLEKEGWIAGEFGLGDVYYESAEVPGLLGTEIGLQVQLPDRRGGLLFDNMTALENLSTYLVPKAGKRIFRKAISENIMQEVSGWFSREELRKPVSEWPMHKRLMLTYYRWYFVNPKLLICLFPFAGQEAVHHELITRLLVLCARRGMAVWIVSSGIDAICEATDNKEFLRRLRYLD